MVINLASQYLPGLAVIKSYGYPPKVNPILGWTGITQTMLAPFRCPSNLQQSVRRSVWMLKRILIQPNVILPV